MEAEFEHRSQRSKRVIVLAGLTVLLAGICLIQVRALASAQDTYQTQLAQLATMHSDAAAILTLRSKPRSAMMQTRASQDVLAQVEQALKAADIDRAAWRDSIPQLPRRVAGTDYKEVVTRLYFEKLSLQQLAGFSHHLRQIDRTLTLSTVNLSGKTYATPEYDVDVGVSYRVFAPRADGIGQPRSSP